MMLRAAAAAALAVVTASAVVGLTASRPAARPARAYTAAYVIGQMRSALAGSDMVMRTTFSFSPTFPPVTQWRYGSRYSMTQQAPGHRRLAAGTAVISGRLAYVAADYKLKEWSAKPGRPVTPAGCSAQLDVVESGGPVDWPAYLRQALSCRQFRYVGRVQIGGRTAIELRASVRGPASWATTRRPGQASPHVSAALYVDPATYVPLQVIWRNTGQRPDGSPAHGTVREDVRLLPPSRGNVAKATVPVPASFRKVPGTAVAGPVFPLLGG